MIRPDRVAHKIAYRVGQAIGIALVAASIIAATHIAHLAVLLLIHAVVQR